MLYQLSYLGDCEETLYPDWGICQKAGAKTVPRYLMQSATAMCVARFFWAKKERCLFVVIDKQTACTTGVVISPHRRRCEEITFEKEEKKCVAVEYDLGIKWFGVWKTKTSMRLGQVTSP